MSEERSECLFCKQDIEKSGKEHIIPESLGNNELVLPKGVVCKKCNNGVLSELDEFMLDFTPIKFFRTIHGIKNKKGDIPDARFGNLIIENTGEGHIEITADSLSHHNLENNKAQINFLGSRKLTCANMKKLARAFYKVGLELIYHDYGHDYAYSDRFDEIRDIILGKADFSGYLLLLSLEREKRIDKVHIRHEALKSNEDGKEFTLFQLSFFGLIKICFDLERRKAHDLGINSSKVTLLRF